VGSNPITSTTVVLLKPSTFEMPSSRATGASWFLGFLGRGPRALGTAARLAMELADRQAQLGVVAAATRRCVGGQPVVGPLVDTPGVPPAMLIF
jgi:hypothetical protein